MAADPGLITSEAQKYLYDRGFTNVDITQCGIRFIQANELLAGFKIPGGGYPLGTVGVVLPHVDINGHETGYHTARMVVPPKLAGWPRPKLMCPANTQARAHFPIINKRSETLYITESYLKAQALSKQGKFAVGVNGCWGWSGGDNSEVIEDIFRLPWEEIKRLVIVWDSNVADNPNVKASAAKLYNKIHFFLDQTHVDVKLLLVPKDVIGKDQGVDDWIARGDFDLDALSEFSEIGVTVEDSPFHELNSRVCYVGGSNIFVDYKDIVLMSERHFFTKFATLKYDVGGEKKPVARAWVSWVDRMERPKIVSRPGQDALLDDAVNIWRKSDVTPIEGDMSVHLEYLARAVPAEVERRYLQQWIGHAVQRPEIKMNVAMVFYSPEEGTGKTMTANSVGRMLGEHNVAKITLAQLREAYNSAYATKQLMIMNENSKSADSRALLEKLKTFITEQDVMVRQMHTNPFPAENHCNVILTMNHADSLPMSTHDRRFNIVQFTPALVREPEYAEEVWNWHRDNAEAMLHYYLNVDLEGFDPFSAPSLNEAKRELISASADQYQRVIMDLLSDPEELFASVGWRKDVRFVSWHKLALSLWHTDGFVDKHRLTRDTTKLGLAFSAHASHYGYDPAKCVKKYKISGASVKMVDLRWDEMVVNESVRRDYESYADSKISR